VITDVQNPSIATRFRGFLPVIIDVETGGFNAKTDALLEVAAFTLKLNSDYHLVLDQLYEYHVEPFEGANLEQAALDFTGIDVESEDRFAEPEIMVLDSLFTKIRQAVKAAACNRAIIVGHNAHFDLGFVHAASARCGIKRNPFHPFSCLAPVTLAGLAVGHTVLAKACQLANIHFDNSQAHSAAYDAQKTAELFCLIVNRWQDLGGWPLEQSVPSSQL
jgi:ribonuclease T